MAFWDKLLGRDDPASKALVNRPREMASRHEAGRQHIPIYDGYRPSLNDNDEVAQGDRDGVSSRAINLSRNSGFLSGVVDTLITFTVGNGLRLNLRPNAQALGWTQEEASDFAAQVEDLWAAFSNDPESVDQAGVSTLGEMQSVAMREYFYTGEVLGSVRANVRRTSPFVTRLQMIEPNRLAYGASSEALIGNQHGITTDKGGRPLRYHVRNRWAENVVSSDFTTLPARVAPGAPNEGFASAIHVFNKIGAGTRRGVSPLVTSLETALRMKDLNTTQMEAASMAAQIVATIYTTKEWEAVANSLADGEQDSADVYTDYLTARSNYYQNAPLNLAASARMNILMPSENMEFHNGGNPFRDYAHLAKFQLQEFAASIGLSYEFVSTDWSNSSYSAARLATAKDWMGIERLRRNVPAAFTQQFFERWLADAIITGLISFPGGIEAFRRNRVFVCRANWAGPKAPSADPLKEVRSQKIALETGLTTLDEQASASGNDWQAQADQRAREDRYYKKLGLPSPHEAQDLDGAEIDAELDAEDEPAPKPEPETQEDRD